MLKKSELGEFRKSVAGVRPRPRIFATLINGKIRKVVSMGRTWVSVIICTGQKKRFNLDQIVTLQIFERE